MTGFFSQWTRTSTIVLSLAFGIAVPQAFSQSYNPTADRTCSSENCNSAHDFDLLVSSSAARIDPEELAGSLLSGNVYIFATQTANQVKTQFWLDRHAGDDPPDQSEGTAPWDFRGGQDLANAWDTRSVPDGPHSITVNAHLADGSVETITSTFIVANDDPKLVFSPAVLSFSADAETDQIFTAAVRVASNTLDPVTASLVSNSSWLSVSSSHAAALSEISISLDTAGLPPGIYRGEIAAKAPGLADATLHVALDIPAPFAENQVHLGWTDDPATAVTVMWRTREAETPSVVRFRGLGADKWRTAAGASRVPAGTDGAVHEVELSGLQPATAYEYQVQISESRFSDVFSMKTASATGPASFDAVFVADLALAGRLDGLDAGIDQILAAITRLNPGLVLLGGDFVSFKSDQRFGTLGRTIDRFFAQMSGFAPSAALMPTFGNHEAFLGENLDEWADRFAVPEGNEEGHSYSFDVADAHFLSIYAPGDEALPESELRWVDQDLGAARDAGQRWLIAFQHVPLFSDGANHGPNTILRDQLGPVFERYGVQLVLTAHDQSFERTFPLSHVPHHDSPTSTSTNCYEFGDGVIYMKVSPGGKLSDITNGFSPFHTHPPPPWTAARDDTGHHFSLLQFSEAGTLRVRTYSVADNRSRPEVADDFTLVESGCPQSL